ncbi:transcription termination factor Rho [Candidatus Woesebacteria bacterium]|nr:transcription termination factor Rho [Candidatus Woesebacteria bacterium]
MTDTVSQPEEATTSEKTVATNTTEPAEPKASSRKVQPIRVSTTKRIPVVPLKKSDVVVQLKENPDQKDSRDTRDTRNNRDNRDNRDGRDSRDYMDNRDSSQSSDRSIQTITGYLDNSRDGHGVIRRSLSGEDEMDAYIATSQIKRLRLQSGDLITGPAREPKDNERFWGIVKVDTVNGRPADELRRNQKVQFQKLTPVYPDSQIKLEMGAEPLDLRIIDMIAPIGKGQRSLIVSPPKAGKTSLLKNIAAGVAKNHPEIHIMAVLVGERPEEVTDIRRHIDRITDGKGEVAASNFDEAAKDQCRVAELALERAKRLVEEGKDVLILLDSITRLARAYNLAIPTSGRTLSGGFDPAALFPPKKFFGAARNFEIQGSLTIVGTALVETGSRMDDLVYEEFKGTGNQEVHLDRRLAERRIFPSIDVQRSGTRRDDLLISGADYLSLTTLHRMLDMLDKDQRSQTMIDNLKKTKSNKEFLASLKNG